MRWIAWACLLSALIPAAVLPKEAPGPKVDRVSLSGWIEVRGPTFTLVTDADKRAAADNAKRLLSFIEVLRATTNIQRFEPRVPIRIVVFRKRFDYARFSIPGTVGVMQPGPLVWHLFVDRQGPFGQETLLHEYAHYLIHNQGLAYPRWFDEGFAELVSTVRFREDLAFLGAVPQARLTTLRGRGSLPLRKILGARNYPKQVALFYAQSWLLTHYLHTAQAFGDPPLLESMQRYLELLHANTPWAAAFDRAFEASVEELEARVAKHRERVTKAGAGQRVLTLEIGLPDTSELRMRRLRPSRIAELLGDAQLALRGDTSLAEKFYRESLRLEPDRPTTQAALARVHARQGRFAPAQKLAEAAAAHAPDSIAVRLALGEVKRLEALAEEPADAALLEEARRVFRTIIESDPSQPTGFVALGLSYVDVEGDVSEGIAALEHVRDQTPGLTPTLELAKLYLAAERRRDARELLWTVVRWHGGGDAEQARALLKELAQDDIDELLMDFETGDS